MKPIMPGLLLLTACANNDDAQNLPHTSTFPSAGTSTIVAQGRQTVSQPDSIVEIQQPLSVR